MRRATPERSLLGSVFDYMVTGYSSDVSDNNRVSHIYDAIRYGSSRTMTYDEIRELMGSNHMSRFGERQMEFEDDDSFFYYIRGFSANVHTLKKHKARLIVDSEYYNKWELQKAELIRK